MSYTQHKYQISEIPKTTTLCDASIYTISKLLMFLLCISMMVKKINHILRHPNLSYIFNRDLLFCYYL